MKKKHYKSAKPFFKKILEDPEIRIKYEEEKAKTEIALMVKRARKNALLTQRELAEKIGTSQSVIARLEGGHDLRTPSLSLLSRIAGVCGGILELGFVFKETYKI